MARRDRKLNSTGHPPPPDKREVIGTLPKAHTRQVALAGMTCVLTVEAQGSDPLSPEPERLRSLQ